MDYALHPFQDLIVRDPQICGGQPTLKGTRVLLGTVLGYLAHGEAIETILLDFPTLRSEHIRAAIAFAASSAAEDLPPQNPDPFRPAP